MAPISVLIADDIATTREDIKRFYISKKKSKLSGKLQMGRAIALAAELNPDVK